jgi:osmoprotectant transport system permease protein
VDIRWDYLRRHQGDLIAATLDHLVLVVVAVAIAAAIAIPLAIVVRNVPLLRAGALGVTGVLYTIPSIALFGMLVPILGLGAAPVIVGLVLYSLLTLVRNTLVGLEQVPMGVREAAAGMGMTSRQVLARVELPLAVPAIVAGLRIATVTAVGIATIGGLVGGGGLGKVINDGIKRDFETLIAAGAVGAILLAILLDVLLVGAQHAAQPWARRGR